MLDGFFGFADWLIDALLWVPRKIWAEILDGLAALIIAIPVPEFVSNAGNSFGNVAASVVWFVEPFELPYGLGVCIGAYVLRFAIRRLPLVG